MVSVGQRNSEIKLASIAPQHKLTRPRQHDLDAGLAEVAVVAWLVRGDLDEGRADALDRPHLGARQEE